jgi:hypothetical protein
VYLRLRRGGYGSKTSNLPLRGAKGTPYEGGLRVPALVRWPAKVKPVGRSDTPIITPEFHPTVTQGAARMAEGWRGPLLRSPFLLDSKPAAEMMRMRRGCCPACPLAHAPPSSKGDTPLMI